MHPWCYYAYNETWAGILRTVTTMVVLTRGSLEIYLRQTGYMAILISCAALLTQTIGLGIVGTFAVGLPWLVSAECGAMLNGLSLSCVVPLCL